MTRTVRLQCFLALCICFAPLSHSQERPTLEFQRWSGDINVPDPVALSVDRHGRVFVTQTRRRKIQDLDIRANRDWVPNDVGLKSIEEKRAFFRAQMAIGGDDLKQKEHVQDVNKDGHHDWRDLTVISESIYRLVDKDNDGTADKITTFAEDFKTEVTGIAAGVLAFNGNVWATIAPDVWKLRDHDGDGKADSREVMATGFGLHIAYGGHDMHGLTVGPDGKVYWSIGDKGINVKGDNGKQFSFPNQGGVMRCNPDGSDFEVFAHGLRNVQEFAFDQYGNIFGVDNDADQPGERERFVAIVDGMDAGWRCNYQYRGDLYNAWTDEKLWELPGEDHPAYIIPPIQHYVDGPAGFKFNPGTALSPEYRDFFFMTNAPRGFQYAFKVQPDGDSFKMTDSHEFGSGHALVGLAFGPDGGLYGADWDGGYPLDEKGAVIRIDVPAEDANPLRKSTQQLLANGFDELPAQRLGELLSHADQRVRMGAQFAIVKKDSFVTLKNTLESAESTLLAKLHCVWGLGQFARGTHPEASEVIAAALSDSDWRLRAQAAKTLGETPTAKSSPLISRLSDESLHVRANAALAIGRLGNSDAVDPLLQQCDSLSADQYYLRHALVRGLAASASSDVLAKQSTHNSLLRRMVCVLALRLQASPLAANYLDDSSNWIATEAARAIHDDLSIVTALPDLAAAMDGTLDRSEAFARRSINANFRLGTAENADRLVAMAGNDRLPAEYRLDACAALGDWLDPPVLDRVEGRRRDLPTESRQVDPNRVTPVLEKLVATADTPLRVAAVTAARKLSISLSSDSLAALVDSRKVPLELRIEALKSIAKDNAAITSDQLIKSSRSASPKLAATAITLLAKQFPQKAFPTVVENLNRSKQTIVQQACIAALARIGSSASDAKLTELLSENPSPKLLLDIVEAIQNRSEKSKNVRDQLPRIEEMRTQLTTKLQLNEPAKTAKYAFSSAGGDPEAGERFFKTNLQAQCSRCHKIGKKGSDIGPELTKIAKQRDAAHLLRSIILPSDEIDKKYFTQAVLLDTGRIVRGVIKSENEKTTVLVNSDGKEIKIATDEIEAVSSQKVSLMPDMTDFLKPRDVRDLVAYLGTLK